MPAAVPRDPFGAPMGGGLIARSVKSSINAGYKSGIINSYFKFSGTATSSSTRCSTRYSFPSHSMSHHLDELVVPFIDRVVFLLPRDLGGSDQRLKVWKRAHCILPRGAGGRRLLRNDYKQGMPGEVRTN